MLRDLCPVGESQVKKNLLLLGHLVDRGCQSLTLVLEEKNQMCLKLTFTYWA